MTLDERVDALTARVVVALDREALAAVAKKHDDGSTSGPNPSKYLDAERWIRICARRAVVLGLDRMGPARVLDLGTGAGYFPLVCRDLGHRVIASDWSGREDIYRELAVALGVDVATHDVRPFGSLNTAPEFDLIAAFMVTFNGHVHAPWSVGEWAWFLSDAFAHLKPGGRLALELNREPDGACYTPELEALFLARGAAITGAWPHALKRGGHRLVFTRG